MSPKDEKYFIFGDIEENEYVLNDVFECIEKNKNASFIFLGDIYTPKSSKKSIQNISKIFDILDIACYDYIGELIDKNNKYKTYLFMEMELYIHHSSSFLYFLILFS